MELVALNSEIIAILILLGLTVILFVFEVIRVDAVALLVLVLLGLSSLVPGYDGLVPTRFLFDGFSSNAVMSIIAIMVVGAGLDKTGVMGTLASFILRYGGRTESRIIAAISGSVAYLSSFMQNIGAAALFLPVVNRISRRTGIPVKRLLMPMGFSAILGGTVTMIGSSPLILLNDLLLSANRSLPINVETMEPYGLFAVAPIGTTLIVIGIAYFLFLAPWLLPTASGTGKRHETNQYFHELYGIHSRTWEVTVTSESDMCGKLLGEIASHGRAGWILGVSDGKSSQITPAQDTEIRAGSVLAIMGPADSVLPYAEQHGLEVAAHLNHFAEILSVTTAGISAVVIPPDSQLIGKSISELQFRRRFGARILSIYRIDRVIDQNISEVVLQAGDTLLMHSRWQELASVADSKDFAVVTDFPRETFRPNKLVYASVCFLIAIGLVIFTALPLSVALMAGAIGMIITGVISIDEAYEAISWQTVFLLACLMPLGLAMEYTGAAAWLASEVLRIMDGASIWQVQFTLGVLATVFTLLMSNVGATVLLVPIAIQIALGVGANPAMFALTVALCTSNSFLIPTHQVNALIMGPAGYRVADFLRAGGGMTILFLLVTTTLLNVFY
ncbi:MAG: SLC13 family permease [Proteobacteria bacterium]|jgi:di/tricarboxylate transporter|nr:SLC13 family permease [Pseudomonadota bacterium]